MRHWIHRQGLCKYFFHSPMLSFQADTQYWKRCSYLKAQTVPIKNFHFDKLQAFERNKMKKFNRKVQSFALKSTKVCCWLLTLNSGSFLLHIVLQLFSLHFKLLRKNFSHKPFKQIDETNFCFFFLQLVQKLFYFKTHKELLLLLLLKKSFCVGILPFTKLLLCFFNILQQI